MNTGPYTRSTPRGGPPRVHGGPGAFVQASLLRAGCLAGRYLRPEGRHRGMQPAARALGRVCDPANRVSVAVGPDARLWVYLSDGYWVPLLDRYFRYEPDVETILSRLVGPDVTFVDAGANIGYWSVVFQRRARQVIAIEAVARTFARLAENVALNSTGEGSIEAVHAAIWSEPGRTFLIPEQPAEHAGASVLPEARAGDPREEGALSEVTSVTVDDLLAPSDPAVVVVKLDVEGAEVAGLAGARATLARRQVAFVYEDHGQHAGAAVSEAFRDVGLRLYAQLGPEIVPVTLPEIAAAKIDPRAGYNFVAVQPNSQLERRLLSAPAPRPLASVPL
jgi:FkbM family methyltransferase